MRDDILMPLKDSAILNVNYDTEYYAGCPTCDYGSSYITNIVIELVNRNIKINSEQMYNYGITEGMLMKLLLQNATRIHNMTEEEFCNYVIDWADHLTSNDEDLLVYHEVNLRR